MDRPAVLTRGLVLITLIAGAASLAATPSPAAALSPAGQQPDSAADCPPPPPDHTPAPLANTAPLAVASFQLQASRLQLHQVDLLASNKIVSVPIRHGSKRVLQFLAGAAELTELRQTSARTAAPALTLTTPPGSTSQLIGSVTLYVEKLCGTLAAGPLGIGFGTPGALLPAISPATPPPAVLPELTFTHVTVYLAGVFSTQLDLPRSSLNTA